MTSDITCDLDACNRREARIQSCIKTVNIGTIRRGSCLLATKRHAKSSACSIAQVKAWHA